MRLALAFSISALSLASASAASTATPPSDEPTVIGFWQESDDEGHVGAWFYFTKVKGHYEGRFVKMFKQKPDDPTFETCSKCMGDQKDAAMIGLTIIKGMHRDGLKYEDGTILDPRDGTLYNALMELSPDGQKLSVRGYLGIPLLGQTQVWDRLPDDTMSACDIPRRSFGPSAPRPKDSATPTPHPTDCDTTASTNLKDSPNPDAHVGQCSGLPNPHSGAREGQPHPFPVARQGPSQAFPDALEKLPGRLPGGLARLFTWRFSCNSATSSRLRYSSRREGAEQRTTEGHQREADDA